MRRDTHAPTQKWALLRQVLYYCIFEHGHLNAGYVRMSRVERDTKTPTQTQTPYGEGGSDASRSHRAICQTSHSVLLTPKSGQQEMQVQVNQATQTET